MITIQLVIGGQVTDLQLAAQVENAVVLRDARANASFLSLRIVPDEPTTEACRIMARSINTAIRAAKLPPAAGDQECKQ